jgi:hypothetical protein
MKHAKRGLLICAHCFELQKKHVKDKCLFLPTVFESLRCRVCNGRITAGGIVKDVNNGPPRHAFCDISPNKRFRPYMKTVTIKYNVKRANLLGLLTCKCGHRENQHYERPSRDRGLCAFAGNGCGCKGYEVTARGGTIVAYTPTAFRNGDVLVDQEGQIWEVFTTLPETMNYMLMGKDETYSYHVSIFTDGTGYTKIGRL